jgi:hypothetical protein
VSPTARMPTKAEAHSSTVVSRASSERSRSVFTATTLVREADTHSRDSDVDASSREPSTTKGPDHPIGALRDAGGYCVGVPPSEPRVTSALFF